MRLKVCNIIISLVTVLFASSCTSTSRQPSGSVTNSDQATQNLESTLKQMEQVRNEFNNMESTSEWITTQYYARESTPTLRSRYLDLVNSYLYNIRHVSSDLSEGYIQRLVEELVMARITTLNGRNGYRYPKGPRKGESTFGGDNPALISEAVEGVSFRSFYDRYLTVEESLAVDALTSFQSSKLPFYRKVEKKYKALSLVTNIRNKMKQSMTSVSALVGEGVSHRLSESTICRLIYEHNLLANNISLESVTSKVGIDQAFGVGEALVINSRCSK